MINGKKQDVNTGEQSSQVTIMMHGEKLFLSGLIALIALCSGLNTPIYWVAIPEIKKHFDITEEQANLTITAYLVFQAVSPMLVCTFSDIWGRRPIILYCMLASLGSNLGLVFCPSYGVMIFLRCLLAAHAAPLIAISSAVVGDFTTRIDRGGYVGFTFGFTLIGSGLAPFIGACLDQRWKWRGIFAFAAILNAISLTLAHPIVGNMSILPRHFIHKSPIIYIRGRKRICGLEANTTKKYKFNIKEIVTTMKLLKDPLVIFALVPNSLIYATWTMSQATMSLSLSDSYHYVPIKVGLCFLAPGIACCISAILCGKLLNHGYKKQHDSRQITEEETDTSNEPKEIPDAQTKDLTVDPENSPNNHQPNIIRARLRYFQPFNLGVVISSILYEATNPPIHQSTNPPIHQSTNPPIHQSTNPPIHQPATNTLLVDLHPENSGAVSSLNNLFRCGLGSIFVSCLTKMNGSLTIGGTYTLMAGICTISSLCLPFVLRQSDSIIRKSPERYTDNKATQNV
ncbi:hypothetical protein HII12_004712 [Brettanomyces bruxellensis]|uniref:Major facilitator superfamily (MFS) profile domain-containing protein n=1 Tax=Dekkera bruxellensis TaxID=5007 RepID=A0A8H6ERA0_DEKBR|nr:hypothetical protein HII12_004712 [Brettanomyces bruxellensis]